MLSRRRLGELTVFKKDYRRSSFAQRSGYNGLIAVQIGECYVTV
jgi:hypothetical protein